MVCEFLCNGSGKQRLTRCAVESFRPTTRERTPCVNWKLDDSRILPSLFGVRDQEIGSGVQRRARCAVDFC